MITNRVFAKRWRSHAQLGSLLALAGALLSLFGVATVEAKRPIWGFHASWAGYCYSHLDREVTRRSHRGQICLPWERRVSPQQKITMAAEAGSETIRINTWWTEGWNEIHPPPRGERHPYKWVDLDLQYNTARRVGMRPIIVILGAPKWARHAGWREHCPDQVRLPCAYPPRRDTLDNFRAWTETLMRRYPEALAIEVWNEPNVSRFWAPRPAPKLYAQLLRRVHAARVRSGFRGSIVLGGLAPAMRHGAAARRAGDSRFLRGVYRHARKSWFDGIGHHPYPFHPRRPAAGWVAGMTRHLKRIIRVRNRHQHRRAGLWLTELGVRGGGEGFKDRTVRPALQGPILKRLYDAARKRPVRAITFYTFVELPFAGAQWESFGVVEAQLRPKPAFCYLRRHLGGLPRC